MLYVCLSLVGLLDAQELCEHVFVYVFNIVRVCFSGWYTDVLGTHL